MKRAPSEQNFDDDLKEDDLNETLVIRQDMTNEEKISYMFYEAAGTFFLCYTYILTNGIVQSQYMSIVYFMVSLVSWEVSCAHFNLGITIAYLFVDIDKFKDIWFKFMCAGIAQVFGAVLAMGCARAVTDVTTYPPDAKIRPNVNPENHKTMPNMSNDSSVKQQIFGAEFIMSFIFYIAWIIIRKTKMTMNVALCDQTINLLKPFFVGLAYQYSRALFSKLTIGVMNPTIIFGGWISNLLTYNQYKDANQDVSMYTAENMGRFVWIYFFSALVAAPLAGFLAKQLLVALKLNDQWEEKYAGEDEDKRKPLNMPKLSDVSANSFKSKQSKQSQ